MTKPKTSRKKRPGPKLKRGPKPAPPFEIVTDLWDIQKGEGPKPFAAFCRYRDARPADRSLAKCIRAYYGIAADQDVSSKIDQWGRWSAKFKWVERARAWDIERDRREREAQVQAAIDMKTRHAKLGMALTGKGTQRLQQMEAEEISPGDAIRMIDTGIKIEQAARQVASEGAGTVLVESDGEGTRIVVEFDLTADKRKSALVFGDEEGIDEGDPSNLE